MRRSLALFAFAAACAPTTGELVSGPGAALDTADLVRAEEAADLAALAAMGAEAPVTDRVVACFSDEAARADVLAAHPELSPAGSVMGCAVFAGATDAVALSAELRGVEGVQMAEPEVLAQPLGLGAPNDPHYERQWHMDTVRAPEAWAMGATGEGVVVAVVDSGFSRGGVDMPALVPGYDFIDKDGDTTDDSARTSHGTHVAGTIAQPADNGVGGVGVAPDAQIMPVRVCTAEGCPSVAVARGIRFAVDNGADVINLSLGGYDRLSIQAAAVRYAIDAGVVVVAASGNDGLTDTIAYPARYPGVISVGASTLDDGIARYSNGSRGLDLVAPGGHCERTVFGAPSGEMEDLDGDASPDCVIQETRVQRDMGTGQDVFLHKGMNGTSMASPHVAGAAALLVGMGVPADRVEAILEDTAVDIAQDGETHMTGAGRLDAAAAVARAKAELTQ